jgi:hypothetical protein
MIAASAAKARVNLRLSVPALCVFNLILFGTYTAAQTPVPTTDPPSYGPYSASFLADGDGLHKSLVKDDSVALADSPWTIYAWINVADNSKSPTLIAGLGDPADEFSRYLALENGNLTLFAGKDNSLTSSAAISAGQWHFLAATFDGDEFSLYSDANRVANGKLEIGSTTPVLEIAPPTLPASNWKHFGGAISGLTLLRHALTAGELKQLAQSAKEFSAVEFEEG